MISNLNKKNQKLLPVLKKLNYFSFFYLFTEISQKIQDKKSLDYLVIPRCLVLSNLILQKAYNDNDFTEKAENFAVEKNSQRILPFNKFHWEDDESFFEEVFDRLIKEFENLKKLQKAQQYSKKLQERLLAEHKILVDGDKTYVNQQKLLKISKILKKNKKRLSKIEKLNSNQKENLQKKVFNFLSIFNKITHYFDHYLDSQFLSSQDFMLICSFLDFVQKSTHQRLLNFQIEQQKKFQDRLFLTELENNYGWNRAVFSELNNFLQICPFEKLFEFNQKFVDKVEFGRKKQPKFYWKNAKSYREAILQRNCILKHFEGTMTEAELEEDRKQSNSDTDSLTNYLQFFVNIPSIYNKIELHNDIVQYLFAHQFFPNLTNFFLQSQKEIVQKNFTFFSQKFHNNFMHNFLTQRQETFHFINSLYDFLNSKKITDDFSQYLYSKFPLELPGVTLEQLSIDKQIPNDILQMGVWVEVCTYPLFITKDNTICTDVFSSSYSASLFHSTVSLAEVISTLIEELKTKLHLPFYHTDLTDQEMLQALEEGFLNENYVPPRLDFHYTRFPRASGFLWLDFYVIERPKQGWKVFREECQMKYLHTDSYHKNKNQLNIDLYVYILLNQSHPFNIFQQLTDNQVERIIVPWFTGPVFHLNLLDQWHFICRWPVLFPFRGQANYRLISNSLTPQPYLAGKTRYEIFHVHTIEFYTKLIKPLYDRILKPKQPLFIKLKNFKSCEDLQETLPIISATGNSRLIPISKKFVSKDLFEMINFGCYFMLDLFFQNVIEKDLERKNLFCQHRTDLQLFANKSSLLTSNKLYKSFTAKSKKNKKIKKI